MNGGSDDDHKYDDIINLPHHRSRKHPPMPLADRAAQFSPFAALTGHGDAVKETARLTETRIELDEEAKASLNARLLFLENNLKEQPEVTITVFVPDERRAGGAYMTRAGVVKRIDEYEQMVVMVDDAVIPINDIAALDGELFNRMDAENRLVSELDINFLNHASSCIALTHPV
jgi:hypothetical protein